MGGLRPRTKRSLRLKSRRCPKCGKLLAARYKRCKRCHKVQPKL
jgi:ribosomal protein S27AE